MSFPVMEYKAMGEPDQIELPANATSLDLLRACYRNSALPLSVRMRAAIAALPFEKPKLSVQAMFPMSEDFADRLQRCIERSALANGAGAKVIEHEGSAGQSPKPLRRI